MITRSSLHGRENRPRNADSQIKIETRLESETERSSRERKFRALRGLVVAISGGKMHVKDAAERRMREARIGIRHI